MQNLVGLATASIRIPNRTKFNEYSLTISVRSPLRGRMYIPISYLSNVVTTKSWVSNVPIDLHESTWEIEVWLCGLWFTIRLYKKQRGFARKAPCRIAATRIHIRLRWTRTVQCTMYHHHRGSFWSMWFARGMKYWRAMLCARPFLIRQVMVIVPEF